MIIPVGAATTTKKVAGTTVVVTTETITVIGPIITTIMVRVDLRVEEITTRKETVIPTGIKIVIMEEIEVEVMAITKIVIEILVIATDGGITKIIHLRTTGIILEEIGMIVVINGIIRHRIIEGIGVEAEVEEEGEETRTITTVIRMGAQIGIIVVDGMIIIIMVVIVVVIIGTTTITRTITTTIITIKEITLNRMTLGIAIIITIVVVLGMMGIIIAGVEIKGIPEGVGVEGVVGEGEVIEGDTMTTREIVMIGIVVILKVEAGGGEEAEEEEEEGILTTKIILGEIAAIKELQISMLPEIHPQLIPTTPQTSLTMIIVSRLR